ncbi:hypothetical protein NFI96_006988, partial [Prochilodus magdalenae]
KGGGGEEVEVEEAVEALELEAGGEHQEPLDLEVPELRVEDELEEEGHGVQTLEVGKTDTLDDLAKRIQVEEVVLRGAAVCRWCCTNRRTHGGHHGCRVAPTGGAICAPVVLVMRVFRLSVSELLGRVFVWNTYEHGWIRTNEYQLNTRSQHRYSQGARSGGGCDHSGRWSGVYPEEKSLSGGDQLHHPDSETSQQAQGPLQSS